MDCIKLKMHARQARRDFNQAITDRAADYGLTLSEIEQVVERGDVVVNGGQEFLRAVAKKPKQLEDRIKSDGFDQTMEAVAYPIQESSSVRESVSIDSCTDGHKTASKCNSGTSKGSSNSSMRFSIAFSAV